MEDLHAPTVGMRNSPSTTDLEDLDGPTRRLSLSSNGSGYALEEDIRAMGDQMRRVLAFCEAQSQNPIRLQAKINELKEQLQLAIEEKNYWMKRCKEVMECAENRINNLRSTGVVQPSTPAEDAECDRKRKETLAKDMQIVKNHPRRKRTNSELIFIADNFGSPGEGIYQDDGSSSSGESDSGSDCVGLERSSFRLLQCSDEQCEVFTPMNRSIRTQHRSRNNVQFMWDQPPKTVLIIKKPNEPVVTDTLVRMTKWLQQERGLAVMLRAFRSQGTPAPTHSYVVVGRRLGRVSVLHRLRDLVGW
ncbi:hypothetical protein PINS_up002002 [Pythium insidiosum]|nr:hypothetical protein PINS_up002002 [Pythium insidiosum]